MKRKLNGSGGASGGTGDLKKVDKRDEEKVAQTGKDTQNMGRGADTGNQENET